MSKDKVRVTQVPSSFFEQEPASGSAHPDLNTAMENIFDHPSLKDTSFYHPTEDNEENEYDGHASILGEVNPEVYTVPSLSPE